MFEFKRIHPDLEDQNAASCLQVVVQKESSRGVHFRRAGPREKVVFAPLTNNKLFDLMVISFECQISSFSVEM